MNALDKLGSLEKHASKYIFAKLQTLLEVKRQQQLLFILRCTVVVIMI